MRLPDEYPYRCRPKRRSRSPLEPGEHVSKSPEPRPSPEMAPRKSFIAPTVTDLPLLENLTLQTGGIPGGLVFDP